MSAFIDIVFDGPPGPDAGRFIEVENDTGHSISIGEWVDRGDGYWVLRLDVKFEIASPDLLAACRDCMENRGDWAAAMAAAIAKAEGQS